MRADSEPVGTIAAALGVSRAEVYRVPGSGLRSFWLITVVAYVADFRTMVGICHRPADTARPAVALELVVAALLARSWVPVLVGGTRLNSVADGRLAVRVG